MTTVSPDLVDWQERQYVSQFSMPPLTLAIHVGGVPADPDGLSVLGQLLLQNPDGTVAPVSSYTALRSGTGTYVVTPSSADTSVPAPAELVWAYAVGGVPQQYASYLTIGPANPAYDALPLDMQDLLETVYVRFADLFDSPSGGANLQTYFQAHWSRGRVAQLMGIALSKINAIAQPWSNYTLDGTLGAEFPISQWGGLLAQYTFVESVKHLIRGYTEQPQLMGSGSVTRLDRRDYVDRWRAVLADEQPELKSLLDVFKIRHLGLGNPRVLVSGGTYGRYAPTRIAGSVAARPRMWARWRSGINRHASFPAAGRSPCAAPGAPSAPRCAPTFSRARGRFRASPPQERRRRLRSGAVCGSYVPSTAVTRLCPGTVITWSAGYQMVSFLVTPVQGPVL